MVQDFDPYRMGTIKCKMRRSLAPPCHPGPPDPPAPLGIAIGFSNALLHIERGLIEHLGLRISTVVVNSALSWRSNTAQC